MSLRSNDDKSPRRGVESTGQGETAAEEISVEEQARRRAVIDAIRAFRDSGKIKPVTTEEILSWRHEGHRY